MGLIFDLTESFELAFVYSTVLSAVSVVLALLIRTTALHSEFTAGGQPPAVPPEA